MGVQRRSASSSIITPSYQQLGIGSDIGCLLLTYLPISAHTRTPSTTVSIEASIFKMAKRIIPDDPMGLLDVLKSWVPYVYAQNPRDKKFPGNFEEIM